MTPEGNAKVLDLSEEVASMTVELAEDGSDTYVLGKHVGIYHIQDRLGVLMG